MTGRLVLVGADCRRMDVYEMGMLGGVGIQLGREVKFLERREELSLLSLDIIKLVFKADPHRQAKSSQP